jgi:hypothetical protein
VKPRNRLSVDCKNQLLVQAHGLVPLRCTAGEEVRWRAELREREAARMAVLEGEWRRREKAREAELAAMRAEYSALDEKARQVGADLGSG